MFEFVIESFRDLFDKGGWVMWVLLVLSIIAVALVIERFWFWAKTNSFTNRRKYMEVATLLRAGKREAARSMVSRDRTVYGRVVALVVDEAQIETAAPAAIEMQRHRLERFMPVLSTIITAAPMLGILGTVTGIISSFDLLSEQAAVSDPREISGGIAEALLSTAAGLIVALIVLFPYNVFRAQIDRTLGRLETLAAAAVVGSRGSGS